MNRRAISRQGECSRHPPITAHIGGTHRASVGLQSPAMKHRVVALAALAILIAACATSSEVEDLKQRIAELEQAAAHNATSTNADVFRDIHGTVEMETNPLNGEFCQLRQYKRVIEGDRIDLRDGAGALVTFGTFESKKIRGETRYFEFVIPDAPTDLGVCRIIADDLWWDLTRADLEEQDWTVVLAASR
jgi:hypothetical protein